MSGLEFFHAEQAKQYMGVRGTHLSYTWDKADIIMQRFFFSLNIEDAGTSG